MSDDDVSSFRILCLDDSEAQLEALVGALRGAGYAASGAQTVDDAYAKTPAADLVIIDFHMPRMNGAEALGRLRAAVSAERMPLFYLYTTDKDAAVSFKAHGFDGAFTAKGDMATIVSQVETARRRLKLKRFLKDRGATR
jgi:CheY-like chemotaxis protein